MQATKYKNSEPFISQITCLENSSGYTFSLNIFNGSATIKTFQEVSYKMYITNITEVEIIIVEKDYL